MTFSVYFSSVVYIFIVVLEQWCVFSWWICTYWILWFSCKYLRWDKTRWDCEKSFLSDHNYIIAKVNCSVLCNNRRPFKHYCVVNVTLLYLLKSSLYWQGVGCSRTNGSLCQPAAAPGLYKAKSHHARLYDYTTPTPSADAFMWRVPSEPLVP